MPLRPGALAASTFAFGLAVTSGEARADSCRPAPLYDTCINSDTMMPHAGPARFLSVGAAETVEAGHLGFGLVADYQSRPIVFKLPSPGPASDEYAVNDQVNGTFLWAYGLTKRLELDFALPITFGQGGTGIAPLTATANRLQDTAVRDVRFGGAWAIVPREDASSPGDAPAAPRVWALTARFEISAPTGDHDQFASDGTVTYLPSVTADYRRQRWFAGAEVGARIRRVEQLLDARVGSQALVALGVGYDLLQRPNLLGVALEARTLPTFAQQADQQIGTQATTQSGNGKVLAPSEWMLSLRSQPLKDNDDFAVQLGGGGPIPTGDANLTVPRFRFALSLRYAPLPKKPKPAAPPEATPPAAPPPRLDLAAAKDVCKDDPDSVDGFKDDDGCPDEDTDKDGIDDRFDKCPFQSEDFTGAPEGCPETRGTP